MAKHLVKCPYCEQQFDSNSEPFIKVGRRYSHVACRNNYLANRTEEEKAEDEFYDYTKQLFGADYNYLVTKKMAAMYKQENGYTYSGMLKSLKWFYEIEHNSIENANGTIGIIPYVYLKAKEYYYALFLAQEANKEKDIALYIPTVKEITIESPEVYVKPPRLFKLEDDDK